MQFLLGQPWWLQVWVFPCCSISHLVSEGFFWLTLSFTYFTLGVIYLVAIPTNIFSANSKHLQTVTNIYKAFKQILTKILSYFRCRKFPLECCATEEDKEKPSRTWNNSVLETLYSTYEAYIFVQEFHVWTLNVWALCYTEVSAFHV